MKNIIATIFLSTCTLAVSTATFAAPMHGKQVAKALSPAPLNKNVNVTYNVLSSIIGTLAGSVELKATQPFSVGITGAYLFNNYVYKHDHDLKYYNVGLFTTYAINSNVMTDGWLVQPTVSYSHIGWSHTSATTKRIKTFSGYSISLSIPVIYQWMWDSGFNMRFGAGPSYSWWGGGMDKPDGRVFKLAISGLGITGLFTLGYAF